jgi:SAM-dependent methyltransferase
VNERSYELAHCVVCGRRNAAVVGDADDFRSEVEALWEYHAPRLRPETPPRRLADRVTFSEPPPVRLVRCVECGLVYRNPTERITDLKALYARDIPSHDALAALHAAQLPVARTQSRRLRRLIGRGGTGLEVGSYVGAFLIAARADGLSFEGLDVNPEINRFARTLNVQVHDGELRDFPAAHPLDAIAIWNTFDQLADPRGVVFEAWRRLRPGGVLALRVPNGAFYVRLRRVLTSGDPLTRAAARALLAQNNLLAFPYRWGFTIESLRRLLDEAGFTVARVYGDALVPTSDEWTRGWARWEERAIKRVVATVARARPAWGPWLELFARRSAGPVQAA